jgi:hypothetical protein
MNFCNKCHKKPLPSNCPSCVQEDHCCCKSQEPYHHFERKEHCCKTDAKCTPSCGKSCSCDKCSPLTSQLDMKEVFYKIKGKNCFSNLNNLGIEKGANLEYIIEKFGRFITSFNYFDVEDNIYESADFVSFMQDLQKDLQSLRLDIQCFCEKFEGIQLSLNTINERLDKLERPHTIDTRGLGFTNNDTIFKILQKLSDHV